MLCLCDDVERIASDEYDRLLRWTVDNCEQVLRSEYDHWNEDIVARERWEVDCAKQNTLRAIDEGTIKFPPQAVHLVREYRGLGEPPQFNVPDICIDEPHLIDVGGVIQDIIDVRAGVFMPVLNVDGLTDAEKVHDLLFTHPNGPRWDVVDDIQHVEFWRWGFQIYPALPDHYALMRRCKVLAYYLTNDWSSVGYMCVVSAEPATADYVAWLRAYGIRYVKAPGDE